LLAQRDPLGVDLLEKIESNYHVNVFTKDFINLHKQTHVLLGVKEGLLKVGTISFEITLILSDLFWVGTARTSEDSLDVKYALSHRTGNVRVELCGHIRSPIY
jgi:hypothetical protein